MISLFVDSFFCVSNICNDSLRTPYFCNIKRVYFRRLYIWLSFYLQHNPPYLLFYSLPYSYALVLKHHSELQFPRLLKFCSRGTLFDSLNSSKILFLYFLIIYPNTS